MDWRWVRCINLNCGYVKFSYIGLKGKKGPRPYVLHDAGKEVMLVRGRISQAEIATTAKSGSNKGEWRRRWS